MRMASFLWALGLLLVVRGIRGENGTGWTTGNPDEESLGTEGGSAWTGEPLESGTERKDPPGLLKDPGRGNEGVEESEDLKTRLFEPQEMGGGPKAAWWSMPKPQEGTYRVAKEAKINRESEASGSVFKVGKAGVDHVERCLKDDSTTCIYGEDCDTGIWKENPYCRINVNRAYHSSGSGMLKLGMEMKVLTKDKPQLGFAVLPISGSNSFLFLCAFERSPWNANNSWQVSMAIGCVKTPEKVKAEWVGEAEIVVIDAVMQDQPTDDQVWSCRFILRPYMMRIAQDKCRDPKVTADISKEVASANEAWIGGMVLSEDPTSFLPIDPSNLLTDKKIFVPVAIPRGISTFSSEKEFFVKATVNDGPYVERDPADKYGNYYTTTPPNPAGNRVPGGNSWDHAEDGKSWNWIIEVPSSASIPQIPLQLLAPSLLLACLRL